MSDTEKETAELTPDSDADRDELRGEMVRSLARGGMTGVQVISWESAQTALTPKRREIIETLRAEDVDSVRALARLLDRDKSPVSQDLSKLAELGIVRYEERGSAKSPQLTQEHVVVEPVV